MTNPSVFQEKYFSTTIFTFLSKSHKLFNKLDSFSDANTFFEQKVGMHNFFATESEFQAFKDFLPQAASFLRTREAKTLKGRGDIQTPIPLVIRIYQHLVTLNFSPSIIVEPTFGLGRFLLCGTIFFSKVKHLYGVEINRRYKWLFGLALIAHTSKEQKKTPTTRLTVFSEDIFKHDFASLEQQLGKEESILIIGNPPWVTAATLANYNSSNHPEKQNKRKVKGILAITGEGNFDLGEAVLSRMLDTFHEQPGKLAFLCKQSVIKKLVKDLPQTNYSIANIQSLVIDSKREFNRSVNAALLLIDLAQPQQATCSVASLTEPNKTTKTFGWHKEKFVSDIATYKRVQRFDGRSKFVWRQGVKHDCAKILELELKGNLLWNKLGEKVTLESDLVYPFVKGSQLRSFFVQPSSKRLLLPQKKLNEDTCYIKEQFPKTWRYLQAHTKFFARRKSVVYQDKPPFSVFGIGDYTFKPFKVAIAGFYKEPIFSVVEPQMNKPVLLDDTAYQIGFDSREEAVFIALVLHSAPVKELLKALVFREAKRPYTKKILMRISLQTIISELSFGDFKMLCKEHLPEKESFPQEVFLQLVKRFSD